MRNHCPRSGESLNRIYMLTRKIIGGCLIGGLLSWLPATAQTGRIAHFSHGGSAATLAAKQAAADNFGEPMPYFVPDSVRYLSGKMALSYGKWHWGGNGSTTDTLKFPEKYSPQQAAKYTRQLYTRAKLIGFDSVDNSHKTAPAVEKPVKSKHKKKAASTNTALPSHSAGFSLGALVILGLAGVGWVFGGKNQPASQGSA